MQVLNENTLEEIARRGCLAGELLGWSKARQRAFDIGIMNYDGEMPDIDPATFGFRYGSEAHPGLDEDMPIDRQMALGLYDAAKTLKRWIEKDAPGWPIDPLDYAVFWMKHEGRAVPADAELIPDLPINEIVMTNWGSPQLLSEWFIAEHEARLRRGEGGYQSLLLEPIKMPVVLVRGEYIYEIVDGWHRTAAMSLVGDMQMRCVVCYVEVEPNDEPILREIPLSP